MLGCGDGCLIERQHIAKVIENVSDWLSYTGGALIKVADLAGSTVISLAIVTLYTNFEDSDSYRSRMESVTECFIGEKEN